MKPLMFTVLSIDTCQRADGKAATTGAAGTQSLQRPLLRGNFLSVSAHLPVRVVSIESVDRNSARQKFYRAASLLAEERMIVTFGLRKQKPTLNINDCRCYNDVI